MATSPEANAVRAMQTFFRGYSYRSRTNHIDKENRAAELIQLSWKRYKNRCIIQAVREVLALCVIQRIIIKFKEKLRIKRNLKKINRLEPLLAYFPTTCNGPVPSSNTSRKKNRKRKNHSSLSSSRSRSPKLSTTSSSSSSSSKRSAGKSSTSAASNGSSSILASSMNYQAKSESINVPFSIHKKSEKQKKKKVIIELPPPWHSKDIRRVSQSQQDDLLYEQKNNMKWVKSEILPLLMRAARNDLDQRDALFEKNEKFKNRIVQKPLIEAKPRTKTVMRGGSTLKSTAYLQNTGLYAMATTTDFIICRATTFSDDEIFIQRKFEVDFPLIDVIISPTSGFFIGIDSEWNLVLFSQGKIIHSFQLNPPNKTPNSDCLLSFDEFGFLWVNLISQKGNIFCFDSLTFHPSIVINHDAICSCHRFMRSNTFLIPLTFKEPIGFAGVFSERNEIVLFPKDFSMARHLYNEELKKIPHFKQIDHRLFVWSEDKKIFVYELGSGVDHIRLSGSFSVDSPPVDVSATLEPDLIYVACEDHTIRCHLGSSVEYKLRLPNSNMTPLEETFCDIMLGPQISTNSCPIFMEMERHRFTMEIFSIDSISLSVKLAMLTVSFTNCSFYSMWIFNNMQPVKCCEYHLFNKPATIESQSAIVAEYQTENMKMTKRRTDFIEIFNFLHNIDAIACKGQIQNIFQPKNKENPFNLAQIVKGYILNNFFPFLPEHQEDKLSAYEIFHYLKRSGILSSKVSDFFQFVKVLAPVDDLKPNILSSMINYNAKNTVISNYAKDGKKNAINNNGSASFNFRNSMINTTSSSNGKDIDPMIDIKLPIFSDGYWNCVVKYHIENEKVSDIIFKLDPLKILREQLSQFTIDDVKAKEINSTPRRWLSISEKTELENRYNRLNSIEYLVNQEIMFRIQKNVDESFTSDLMNGMNPVPSIDIYHHTKSNDVKSLKLRDAHNRNVLLDSRMHMSIFHNWAIAEQFGQNSNLTTYLKALYIPQDKFDGKSNSHFELCHRVSNALRRVSSEIYGFSDTGLNSSQNNTVPTSPISLHSSSTSSSIGSPSPLTPMSGSRTGSTNGYSNRRRTENYLKCLNFCNNYNSSIPQVIIVITEDVKALPLSHYLKIHSFLGGSPRLIFAANIILSKVLQTLYQLHKSGVILRTLYPDNIMLNPQTEQVTIGNVYDCQYISGNYLPLPEPFSDRSNPFLPPEYFLESPNMFTKGFDIWQFGILLLYVLTGYLPPSYGSELSKNNNNVKDFFYDWLSGAPVVAEGSNCIGDHGECYIQTSDKSLSRSPSILNLDSYTLLPYKSSKANYDEGKIFLNIIASCLQIDPLKRPKVEDLLRTYTFNQSNQGGDILESYMKNPKQKIYVDEFFKPSLINLSDKTFDFIIGIVSALVYQDEMSPEDEAYSFPLDSDSLEKVIHSLFDFHFLDIIISFVLKRVERVVHADNITSLKDESFSKLTCFFKRFINSIDRGQGLLNPFINDMVLALISTFAGNPYMRYTSSELQESQNERLKSVSSGSSALYAFTNSNLKNLVQYSFQSFLLMNGLKRTEEHDDSYFSKFMSFSDSVLVFANSMNHAIEKQRSNALYQMEQWWDEGQQRYILRLFLDFQVPQMILHCITNQGAREDMMLFLSKAINLTRLHTFDPTYLLLQFSILQPTLIISIASFIRECAFLNSGNNSNSNNNNNSNNNSNNNNNNYIYNYNLNNNNNNRNIIIEGNDDLLINCLEIVKRILFGESASQVYCLIATDVIWSLVDMGKNDYIFSILKDTINYSSKFVLRFMLSSPQLSRQLDSLGVKYIPSFDMESLKARNDLQTSLETAKRLAAALFICQTDPIQEALMKIPPLFESSEFVVRTLDLVFEESDIAAKALEKDVSKTTRFDLKGSSYKKAKNAAKTTSYDKKYDTIVELCDTLLHLFRCLCYYWREQMIYNKSMENNQSKEKSNSNDVNANNSNNNNKASTKNINSPMQNNKNKSNEQDSSSVPSIPIPSNKEKEKSNVNVKEISKEKENVAESVNNEGKDQKAKAKENANTRNHSINESLFLFILEKLPSEIPECGCMSHPAKLVHQCIQEMTLHCIVDQPEISPIRKYINSTILSSIFLNVMKRDITYVIKCIEKDIVEIQLMDRYQTERTIRQRMFQTIVCDKQATSSSSPLIEYVVKFMLYHKAMFKSSVWSKQSQFPVRSEAVSMIAAVLGQRNKNDLAAKKMSDELIEFDFLAKEKELSSTDIEQQFSNSSIALLKSVVQCTTLFDSSIIRTSKNYLDSLSLRYTKDWMNISSITSKNEMYSIGPGPIASSSGMSNSHSMSGTLPPPSPALSSRGAGKVKLALKPLHKVKKVIKTASVSSRKPDMPTIIQPKQRANSGMEWRQSFPK